MNDELELFGQAGLDLGKHDLSVTFLFNKSEPIHRWYPYVEGFSGKFVKKCIQTLSPVDKPVIFDPFAGCGTTPVEAICQGLDTYGIDVNPFTCFTMQVKTNLNIDYESFLRYFKEYNVRFLKEDRGKLINSNQPLEEFREAFGEREYFSSKVLRKLWALKQWIGQIDDHAIRDIFRFSVASILIEVSNLRRSPDLRYKPNPLDNAPVFEKVGGRLTQIRDDIKTVKAKVQRFGEAEIHQLDARRIHESISRKFDLTITSPPYLNGTNYIRNSKLELWWLGFIEKESDLKALRQETITAGINSVQRKEYPFDFATNPTLKDALTKVQENAYDKRIPLMIHGYFSDMDEVLQGLYKVTKEGGRVVWVVGDSLYGGVHIPTDQITIELAQDKGFKLHDSIVARKRRSRGGAPLVERIIVLEK